MCNAYCLRRARLRRHHCSPPPPLPSPPPSPSPPCVERTGVEKVMGKMHFYVCERVKNRTNLHRPDGSRPSLWLGLSWPAAAWLLGGSRRQCGDTPPQHRPSTLLPPPSPPSPPAPFIPPPRPACTLSDFFSGSLVSRRKRLFL